MNAADQPSASDLYRLGMRAAALPEAARNEAYDFYRRLCGGFSWEAGSHALSRIEWALLEREIERLEHESGCSAEPAACAHGVTAPRWCLRCAADAERRIRAKRGLCTSCGGEFRQTTNGEFCKQCGRRKP